ncbi:spore germination protein [Clostridium sp. 19966]|uniref:spore germination protein n=1 Tax=Clostridium sp. 19966 TaxID=2768166 RepID=UPI0028DF489F|nr:spore germination protein [Clostridium sp. 19966]MDT8717995.1 spore germination protein [Clostridium sp. 19966]
MESDKPISSDLNINIDQLTEKFRECPDIMNKKIIFKDGRKGCFFYLKGFVNIGLIQRDFVKPLLSICISEISDNELVDYLPIFNTSVAYEIDAAVTAVLKGKTVLFIDKLNYSIVCDLTDIDKRNISEPEGEKNVRGPHEGFIESLETNISIVRRKIKDSNLKFKNLELGTKTKQTVSICYIEGIANTEMLNELFSKINKINTDGLMAIGYIEQYISSSPNSPFPQYMATERPDKAVAALLEGRLVVLMEGTPFVLIAPVSLWSFLQALDDYSTKWMLGSFVRLIRILSVLVAVLLPSLYVAVTTFQYYIVPLNLLVPLAVSRTQVAFPPVVEALVMEFTIEMIREASIRLPTYLATTIGVVGGIIIGQAAVNAGIVSSLFIIVVAVTAMASYVVPIYDFGLAIRLFRFLLLILASAFGIIGIIVGIAFLTAHLLSLESLGQPYVAPIQPIKIKDLKDSIIRAPLGYMENRPSDAKPLKKKRGSN